MLRLHQTVETWQRLVNVLCQTQSLPRDDILGIGDLKGARETPFGGTDKFRIAYPNDDKGPCAREEGPFVETHCQEARRSGTFPEESVEELFKILLGDATGRGNESIPGLFVGTQDFLN